MRGTSVLLLLLVAHYSVAQKSTEEDGKEDSAPQIYGGDDVDSSSDFGFVVRINYLEEPSCAGSIIFKRVILTAAHCVTEEDGTKLHPETVRVIVGDHKLDEKDPNEVEHEVVRFVLHKDYDQKTLHNDIALIFLKEEIAFTNGISKVILPTDESHYEEGTTVTLVGWGGTEDADFSNIRQVYQYEMSNQEACAEFWTKIVADGMVCTGNPPLKGHAWAGDSGGPVFVKVDVGYIQVALITWGVEEPDENAYDINTNVFYYKEWIDRFAEEADEDDWLGLRGGSDSSGVVVYHIVETGTSYVMCNDGVGQNEVNTICKELGYEFGIAKRAEDYKKGTWDGSFDKIPYMGTDFKCNDQANSIDDCTWTQFDQITDTTIPCFSGQQVAVQCADSAWEFDVTNIAYKVKASEDSTILRGRATCEVEARKYGTDINIGQEVMGLLLNVNEGYEVELLTGEMMKYKRRKGVFLARLRAGAKVEHHCVVCLAALKRNWYFHTYMVEREDCKADDVERTKVAVEAWIAEQINRQKDA